MLQAIYRYIVANYPWASAIEYSTIPNIPEYVIENRKGDCGQVAHCLSPCCVTRVLPVTPERVDDAPGEVNLHDWAEVYFEVLMGAL